MDTASRELRTAGTVVGHEKRRHGVGGKTSILVHAVVEFEAEGGVVVEFESPLGSNIPPKIGETVEVFYDPSRPEEARTHVGSALRLTKWHFIIAAAIFAVPMFLLFVYFLVMVVIAFI